MKSYSQLLNPNGKEVLGFLSFGNDFQLKARIGWQGLTRKEYREYGDYKLVTGTDFTCNNRIDFDNCVYVEKERYDQDEYIQLREGDVLITKDGTLGKIAIIDNLPMPATLNGGVFVVRDLENRILPKFLMYYLTSFNFTDWMKHNHTQGSIQHLTQKLLVKFQIPILPREEQEQIVCILDAFIAIIENLKQQLQLRRKQYEYYRNQLFAFEGEKGVAYKKLCDICDIRGRIGFRGYTRNDQVNKGEGALTLTATNIKDGKLDFSNNTYISWAKYEESPEIMVKNGDIIVCQRGSIGKIALIEELEEEATINPQLLLMKDFKISSKYAITYFLSDYFQNDLRKIIGQGTIQMISQKDFGNLVIPLPSVEKQNDIIKSLSVFEASIENLNQQLILREKQYEYYKDRLLTFK